MSLVRAEYGPTLAEIAGPRLWRALRIVLAAIVVVGAAAALVARFGPSGENVVRRSGPVAFNFVYTVPLHRTGPASVAQRRRGLLIQSMDVTPAYLAPYRGDAAGVLPIVAERLRARLAARWQGFAIADEGRARINLNPGYTIGWTAVVGGRRIFGRDYLLFPDQAGARRGAHLELLSSYAAGTNHASDVGRVGALKTPLRSFRFGTERP